MRTLFRLTLVLPIAIAACNPDLPTAPLAPALARAGKPGGGGSTDIVPIKLGNLKDIGCSGVQMEGVSAGLDPIAPTLAVGLAFCGGTNKPYIWSSKEGLFRTGASPGGWAMAASDNGVVVGRGPNKTPVVFDKVGQVTGLPLPGEYAFGAVTAITPDGRYALGNAAPSGGATAILRWTNNGAVWSMPEIVGPGIANGISAAGDLIVGRQDRRATAWRRNGGWSPQYLISPAVGDPVDLSVANAVNARGTVIVGRRDLPLPRDPTQLYDNPVAWIANAGGGWDLVPLKGADPNFDEGEAFGVADQSDGSTVVAGFAWENTSGPGGTMWALAWRGNAGTGLFGLPIRLLPLNKTYGAMARDVSTRGEVVGTAWTGSSSSPVMWTLPTSP